MLVSGLATACFGLWAEGIYRRPGPRGILFVSIASAAESFRSTCGFERGAPESSTQRFPEATPHVGQGTEDNCLGVSSLIFIRKEYGSTRPRYCAILNNVSNIPALPPAVSGNIAGVVIRRRFVFESVPACIRPLFYAANSRCMPIAASR